MGEISGRMMNLLLDRSRQSGTLTKAVINNIQGQHFKLLDVSLLQAIRHLGSVFPLLTRQERRVSEHQLRFWAAIRETIGTQLYGGCIVSTPDNARTLLVEIGETLGELLTCGEFVILDMCIPIQVGLLAHVEDQLKRWGSVAPSVDISPHRPSYPFHDDMDQVLLRIENCGTVAIDHALIVIDAGAGVTLSTPSLR